MDNFNFDDYAKEQDESRRKALEPENNYHYAIDFADPNEAVMFVSKGDRIVATNPKPSVPYERFQELAEAYEKVTQASDHWKKMYDFAVKDWGEDKAKLRTLEEQLENSTKLIPVDWRTSRESGPELNTLMLGFLGLSVPELCQKDWAVTEVSKDYAEELRNSFETFKAEYLAEFKPEPHQNLRFIKPRRNGRYRRHYE